MSFSLDLPIPPSTNGLFRNAGRGDNTHKRIKTKKYRDWIDAATFALIRQGRPAKIEGPVRLAILVERKRKNSDISNRIKALEDFLVSQQLIDDDKNVQSLSIAWASIEGATVYVDSA